MATPFPDLLEGELVLSPGGELMFRNVHPTFYDGGVGMVSSQAFRPNSDDQGCMSVTQSSILTAVDAFIDYTVVRGRDSIGVWAVSTEEVDSAGSRTVNDCGRTDLGAETLPPGHAYVDFRDLAGSSSRETSRGKKFRTAANARGCQYLEPA